MGLSPRGIAGAIDQLLLPAFPAGRLIPLPAHSREDPGVGARPFIPSGAGAARGGWGCPGGALRVPWGFCGRPTSPRPSRVSPDLTLLPGTASTGMGSSCSQDGKSTLSRIPSTTQAPKPNRIPLWGGLSVGVRELRAPGDSPPLRNISLPGLIFRQLSILTPSIHFQL